MSLLSAKTIVVICKCVIKLKLEGAQPKGYAYIHNKSYLS